MWTAAARALALVCVLEGEPPMADRFLEVLPLVGESEGGWSSHPADPGGDTMRGVTQRTYDDYRDDHDLPRRTVRRITDAEVHAIYRAGYWDKVRADDLPAGLDYAVFDYAVNSGPSRAARELQRILGVARDGVIGPITLGAANAADVERTINRLCDRRLGFLRALRIFGVFGRGWTRRVARVRADALRMAAEAATN